MKPIEVTIDTNDFWSLVEIFRDVCAEVKVVVQEQEQEQEQQQEQQEQQEQPQVEDAHKIYSIPYKTDKENEDGLEG